MGRILSSTNENSPLLPADVSMTVVPGETPDQDFWDQYLKLQKFAAGVSEHQVHVNVEVFNHATGKSAHFPDVVLKAITVSH